jgi:hypothetical protein
MKQLLWQNASLLPRERSLHTRQRCVEQPQYTVAEESNRAKLSTVREVSRD